MLQTEICTIAPLVFKKRFKKSKMYCSRTMHANGRGSIAIGHLSDLCDLKIRVHYRATESSYECRHWGKEIAWLTNSNYCLSILKISYLKSLSGFGFRSAQYWS